MDLGTIRDNQHFKTRSSKDELGGHYEFEAVSPILFFSRPNLRYPQIFGNYLVLILSLQNVQYSV